MKFKKAAALTMAAAMTLGVTGGMPVSADDDIYEVVVQFPTLGTTPSDLQKVEDAINERTESEIGVHVTFYPVSAFETNNTTSRMVRNWIWLSAFSKAALPTMRTKACSWSSVIW